MEFKILEGLGQLNWTGSFLSSKAGCLMGVLETKFRVLLPAQELMCASSTGTVCWPLRLGWFQYWELKSGQGLGLFWLESGTPRAKAVMSMLVGKLSFQGRWDVERKCLEGGW